MGYQGVSSSPPSHRQSVMAGKSSHVGRPRGPFVAGDQHGPALELESADWLLKLTLESAKLGALVVGS